MVHLPTALLANGHQAKLSLTAPLLPPSSLPEVAANPRLQRAACEDSVGFACEKTYRLKKEAPKVANDAGKRADQIRYNSMIDWFSTIWSGDNVVKCCRLDHVLNILACLSHYKHAWLGGKHLRKQMGHSLIESITELFPAKLC